MECTANITDDVQCGYIEGNYVKSCDGKYCQEPERVKFGEISFEYMVSMSCLLVLLVISTVFLVFT